jgi:hypothetical protein
MLRVVSLSNHLFFGACDLDFCHPSSSHLIGLSFIEQTGRLRPEAPLAPDTIHESGETKLG